MGRPSAGRGRSRQWHPARGGRPRQGRRAGGTRWRAPPPQSSSRIIPHSRAIAKQNHRRWRRAVGLGQPRRLVGLADRAPDILDALDDLPRSLAHGDACPQNLLADPRAADRFVAIDWGFVGLAPIGYDLGQLLVGRVESGDLAVDQLPAVRGAIVDGYLAGLHDEGAPDDPAEVLRGFIGGLLLRSAFTALPLHQLRGRADGGMSAEFSRRAHYARFLLEQRHVVLG